MHAYIAYKHANRNASHRIHLAGGEVVSNSIGAFNAV